MEFTIKSRTSLCKVRMEKHGDLYEGYLYDPFMPSRERVTANPDPFTVFKMIIAIAERWGIQKMDAEFTPTAEGAITKEKLKAIFECTEDE